MNNKKYSFINLWGDDMEEKRINLENAAHKVFLEKGYKNTNISDITKEADMAVGSFYKYYKSKRTLFLAVYIKENERVRNKLISDIDWDEEPSKIIDDLFDYLLEVILNNNILAEWNKPEISDTLREYYYSETGKEDYTFHSHLVNVFNERLYKESYSKDMMDRILKVYDFIYFIDCNISNKDFDDYEETLRILVKYFIKGVFS